MSLDVALIIRGDAKGAAQAIQETKTAVEGFGTAARNVDPKPVEDVGTAIGEVTAKAPDAKTAVEGLGTAAETSGGKFTQFQSLALGAIGGLAAGVASAGLDLLFSTVVSAAKEYFDEVTNSADNIKADLELHKGLIRDIKDLWDQADGAASNYGLTSAAGLRFEAEQNIGRLEPDFQSELGRVAGSQSFNAVFPSYYRGGDLVKSPMAPLMAAIKQDLEDGKADIIAWREEIVRLASGTELGSPERTFAGMFLEDTRKAAEMQAELSRAVDLFRSLTGDAEAATRAMGENGQAVEAHAGSVEASLPALREYERLMRSIGGGQDPIGGGARFSELEGFYQAGGGVRTQGGVTGGGFAAGGYTGDAPTDRVTGFVHGREYVFDAAATAAIGVENLEAIRRGVRGYASGGYVGGAAGGAVRGGGFADALAQGDELAGVFALLKGAAGDVVSGFQRTGDAIGAFQDVTMSLARRFFSAAGGAFDAANPGLGGIGGAVTGLLGQLFGGFRANGGDIQPDRWYIAGENGPEPFYSGVAGTMLPNAALGAGGGQVLRIVLQDDSGRMAEIADRQIRTATGQIVQVSVERSRQSVDAKMARGGYRQFGAGPGLKRS